MKYRPLGTTGIEVSEIGFGAWGIGGLTDGMTSYGATDDAESLGALKQAYAEGINFYDTSNVYGTGHSETLIGRAFSDCRDRVIIASKAGFTGYDSALDFSPDHLWASLEQSLARLGSDYLDLFQLHNPDPASLRDMPEIGEALAAMKTEGLIRAYGISAKGPEDAIGALEVIPFDVVQINLNMMDIRAVDTGLLRLAAERGAGIIARTPLCFGFLSGQVTAETRFPPGDHRHLWSRQQIQKWADGARQLHMAVPSANGQSRTQTALRFCLSHDPVSVVIPGIMTAEEALENALASELGPLSAAELHEVYELHSRLSFFVHPGR